MDSYACDNNAFDLVGLKEKEWHVLKSGGEKERLDWIAVFAEIEEEKRNVLGYYFKYHLQVE